MWAHLWHSQLKMPNNTFPKISRFSLAVVASHRRDVNLCPAIWFRQFPELFIDTIQSINNLKEITSYQITNCSHSQGRLFSELRVCTSTKLQKIHPSLQTSHSIKEANNAALLHHHSHHFERLLLSRPRSRPLVGARSEVSNRLPSPPPQISPSWFPPPSPAIRAADLPRRCFSRRCLALDLVSGSQKWDGSCASVPVWFRIRRYRMRICRNCA